MFHVEHAARRCKFVLGSPAPRGIIESVPFTLSHAAAALPFRRTRLIFSAVVAGSFAPDFEYFARLGPYGKFGHSLPGVFLFDLPMALVMLGLYSRYAREPLRGWLPESVLRRFPPDPAARARRGWGWWMLAAVSVLVGIATHILWDSFTHATYWPYRHIAFLGHTVTLPIVGPVYNYMIFQQLSSILGLVALGIWVWRQPPSAPQPVSRPSGRRDGAMLAVLSGIAVAAGLVRALTSVGIHRDRHALMLFVAVVVVAAMTVFWAEVVVLGAVRARRRGAQPAAGPAIGPEAELAAPGVDRGSTR